MNCPVLRKWKDSVPNKIKWIANFFLEGEIITGVD